MQKITASELHLLTKKAYTEAKKTAALYRFSVSFFAFTALFTIYLFAETNLYLVAPIKIIAISIIFLLSVLLFLLFPTAKIKKKSPSALRTFLAVSGQFELQTYTHFYRDIAAKAEIPELKYLLDLSLETGASITGDLKDSAEKQLETLVSHKDAPSRIKALSEMNPVQKMLNRFYLGFAALVVLWLIPFLYGNHAFQRSLEFWLSFEKPNPFSYSVSPSTLLVEQGHNQIFQIQFKGKEPSKIIFEFKTEIEHDYRSFSLMKDSAVYLTEFIQLTQTGSFRFKMDEYYSKVYPIEVQTLPRFDSLFVQITPPSYTSLAPFVQTYPSSSIEFPEGSALELRGFVNKAIQEIEVHSSHNDSLFMVFKENFLWTSSLIAQKADTLRFSLTDTYSLQNSNPYPLQLNPFADNPPSVLLLQPAHITSISTETSIELLYETADDYGLSASYIEWKVKRLFSDKVETGRKKILTGTKTGLRSYVWDFSAIDLQPQEEITYWIKVWDNDGVNGPKSAKSLEFILRIPSLTEQFLGEQEMEESIGDTFSEIKDDMNKMSQEYREFLEKMAENPRQSLENQRKLDNVKQQQQELDKTVEEINKKFEELKKELEVNNQLSEETQKAYEDLQKLVEEIKDNEFLKALEDLQKALNNFDQRSIQQAMQQVKFDEEKYRERIARTMELFKQIKLNADTERLQKALEDLAQKQEALANDSTSKASENAQKQDQLNKELEKLDKMTEDLAKNPPEKMQQSVQEFTEAMKEKISEAQSEMKEAKEQLEQNNSGGAKPKQKSAKEKLKEAGAMASEFKEQMGQKQKSIDKQALEHILVQLLLISESEESIMYKTNDLDQKSNGFIQQARGQQVINSVFSLVADSLFRVASVNPGFSSSVLEKKNETQRNLDRSLNYLTERDRVSSVSQLRVAMGGVNELASILVSILEQSDNSSDGEGGGGGMSPEQMMQQMKDLSGQQQQMNQQMQEMINDMQGNRLSQEGMERLEQLSKTQQKILKQLEELQKNGNFKQGDKMMSELKRLAEEMEDSINDMRGGRTDKIVVKRQQNILSRMLQAEKAMEEREEDEKRKGEQVKESIYSNPPPVTLEELKKRIMLQLQNGELTPYTKDYQKLIDMYFKELEKRIN
ncbi:MAG: hypothetical protein GW823_09105 [Bacteroidetes bacterium]|nr:hypothetical protein [Bacteroidota bacterium]